MTEYLSKAREFPYSQLKIVPKRCEVVDSLTLTHHQWQKISAEMNRLLTMKQVTTKNLMSHDTIIAMMMNLIIVGGGKGSFT